MPYHPVHRLEFGFQAARAAAAVIAGQQSQTLAEERVTLLWNGQVQPLLDQLQQLTAHGR